MHVSKHGLPKWVLIRRSKLEKKSTHDHHFVARHLIPRTPSPAYFMTTSICRTSPGVTVKTCEKLDDSNFATTV